MNNEDDQNSVDDSKKSEDENIENIFSYGKLLGLEQVKKDKLNNIFKLNMDIIKQISFAKALSLIKSIPVLCRLHYNSLENKKLRNLDEKKHHPIQPVRGEIYNAMITDSIGSEINSNHLVVIISNSSTNIFAEKVNVVPIEGDGCKVPKYLVQLKSEDLVHGHLDKSPSRIIIPEIITIDKARLQRKIGMINTEKIKEINRKIMKQLDIKIKDC